ncbi:unnamed protein product [Pedinophyceae sp. YPF-701]|nr:unnamed protein product [Pedinophyceae sp. YPF-701]
MALRRAGALLRGAHGAQVEGLGAALGSRGGMFSHAALDRPDAVRPYTGGTEFLGTPANQDELNKKRPISPHVFDIGSLKPHYKMPASAISSITNRVTGVALYGLLAGVGAANLAGMDVNGMIEGFRAAAPVLVFPTKFVLAYPIVYHWMAGVRHLYWDHAKYDNQAQHNSPLEKSTISRNSNMLMAASVLATAGMAVVSI